MEQGLFLDCGGHVGESISNFKDTKVYKDSDWTIHTFEPHDELADRMISVDDEDVTLHRKAVWVEDGSITFYPTGSRSDYIGVKDVPWGSSTVVEKKTSGDIRKKAATEVDCLDFSAFIEKEAKDKDIVILKMDIEGAEYKVIDHLISTGTIEQVDVLFVEFHYQKMKGLLPLIRHIRTKLKLRRLEVEIIEEGKEQKIGNWFGELETLPACRGG